MTKPAPMSMCLMAETRKGIMEKPLSAFVMGIYMLVLAKFVHKFWERFQITKR